jgi:hypothetical protein
VVPTEKEILEKVKTMLKEEGINLDDSTKSSGEMLEDFILPGLKSSKDTLQAIYAMQVRDRGGLLGKIKSLFQRKLVNNTINVIEKQSMRQQKFNELSFRAIELLIKENKELKQRLDSLQK